MKDFEYAIKELERALQIAEDYKCDKVQIPVGAGKVALTVLKSAIAEDEHAE